jgi:hypothetical protein
MFNYAIIDSGHHKAFGYVGGFDLEGTWGLMASLSGYSWQQVLLSYTVDLGLDACLHIKI